MGGTVVGRDDILLTGVASLERAGPGDLSYLAAARYLPALARTRAGAVLVRPDLREAGAAPATCIVVADPARALARATHLLHPAPAPCWRLHPTAVLSRGVRWSGRVSVGPGAILGDGVLLGTDCVIGPYAVLEEAARLGAACRIGAHSVIHAGTRLGDRVVVKPGARVGGEGFGFAPGPHGHERVPHVGGCVIGDDVEIGANVTVDRGKLDATVIGAGTKIDNLVHVGHTVRVGERCLVLAQVGIAGSTVVEDDVVLAGQAGLADHVRVGRGARVAGQSGVIGDIPAGATVSGYPARPHREVLRQTAALRRLTPLVDDLERVARPSA